MRIIGDFHIHSKYSRATSPATDLENLDKWATIKGVDVLGTGDFTHPGWTSEIKEKLRPLENGLFGLKEKESKVRFLLTTEISCIYKKGGKVRKVHVVLFAPSLEVVEKINRKLAEVGNLNADGRPILGLDAKELLKIVLDADENCLVVPAHIWTPWFSVFGSKSGFDSLEECFDEYAKYIFAVETGLSSDPKMNWQLQSLDNVTLISNSDAHSAPKIGREANVFDTELDYGSIIKSIKTKQGFLHTIEFFPEEGKYHFDGHASCGISLSPEQSKKYNNVCPKCKKPLVIGVLNRVQELADRPYGFVPPSAIFYKSLIPLEEVIADAVGTTPASKKVAEFYNKLIQNLKNEFNVLLEAEIDDIKKYGSSEIAEGVSRVREGRVLVDPGYDGVYGKIKIFDKAQRNRPSQKTLL
jgi:uncharacterized protein (TIGR00375 family)